MRADLHVHTWASTQSGAMKFLRSRDCYSSPFDVYRTARARGMDLVTFTDHDSIDGCLELLDRHPETADFICGEEVSCRFPDGDIEVHLGVYGMTEALHRDLQPLRGNVFEVIARLREADVFFALNHLLHFYRRAGASRGLSSPAARGAGARSAQRRDAGVAQRLHRALRSHGAAGMGRHRWQRCAHAASSGDDVDRGARGGRRRRVSGRSSRWNVRPRRRQRQRAGHHRRRVRGGGAIHRQPGRHRAVGSSRLRAGSPVWRSARARCRFNSYRRSSPSSARSKNG